MKKKRKLSIFHLKDAMKENLRDEHIWNMNPLLTLCPTQHAFVSSHRDNRNGADRRQWRQGCGLLAPWLGSRYRSLRGCFPLLRSEQVRRGSHLISLQIDSLNSSETFRSLVSVPNKRELISYSHLKFHSNRVSFKDIHWPGSHDGPPPDVPECGFLGNDPDCQTNGIRVEYYPLLMAMSSTCRWQLYVSHSAVLFSSFYHIKVTTPLSLATFFRLLFFTSLFCWPLGKRLTHKVPFELTLKATPYSIKKC